ncbi:hypothetical protein [Streptomyces sp. NPDC060035]|uniref:hypothetical protein n=1 Tax=Streptomyces sp. NPDC060035 TaxID=3347044 RepID=UPI0036C6A1B9
MDRLVRSGVVFAAGLVAALTLTACGSGDDSGKAKNSDAGQSATPGAGTEDSGEPGADAAALDGTWAGLSGGKAVALSVASGKVALVADQHVCQGDVKDMGKVMLALSCTDGNTDRTMGSIESNDGRTLVVSWDAGAKDTLTKTDTGKLPTGLPDVPAP